VIEEAGEVALAGAAGNKEELSEEIGDLLYHALVLMAANDIKPEDVWAVLRKRRR
jgi:phosphoribosyl-ATP pyrophosphohydrolase